MAFREVSVYEIREVLRLWLLGYGVRTIDRLTGADRKTIRRYLDAAQKAGLAREAGEKAITDELIGQVVDAVRPARPGGRGKNWELLEQHRDFLEKRIKKNLTLVKIQDQFTRHTGFVVPYATLRRFCICEFGWHKTSRSTVRLADCDPDPATGRKRVAKALIFTSVYSRHQFVFLTFHETLESIIEGFEAAWAFFGGVFKVVIPDNVKAIVTKADDVSPRLSDGFLEYMQSRGLRRRHGSHSSSEG